MKSKPPAKIVHMTSVHQTFDVRIFHKECRSLAAAGYDVTLIAPHNRDEERDGVKISHIRKGSGNRLSRMLFTGMRVFGKAWAENADLYHFHDPELMPWAALLRLRGKVVYDAHEDMPRQILSKAWVPAALRHPLSFLAKTVERGFSIFVFSGIIAATPSIANNHPERKTSTVQNFPVLGELVTGKAELAMEERPANVLYLGGINEIRGIFEMLQAMEQVKTANAKLILVGEFSRQEVKTGAMELNGWQYTEFMGWRDRTGIPGIIARARLGLVLFHPEPNHINAQPNKIFEYMSAGLPVIASDFPLWKEIVETNNCGLCVDPLDSGAIAEAIDWIFEHPQEAEKMGQCGKKAVQEIYNWDAEEKKLLEFYEKLLS